jgi:hypothetical protein
VIPSFLLKEAVVDHHTYYFGWDCFTCGEALTACEEKNRLHWLLPNLRVHRLQIGLEANCPCQILNRSPAYLTDAIYNHALRVANDMASSLTNGQKTRLQDELEKVRRDKALTGDQDKDRLRLCDHIIRILST